MNKQNILTFPGQSPVLKRLPAKIHPGFNYRFLLPETEIVKLAQDSVDAGNILQSGMLGAYRLGADAAVVDAVALRGREGQGFVWEPNLLSAELQAGLQIEAEHPGSVLQNSLTISDVSLDTPEVQMLDGQSVLTVSPHFNLVWHTEAFASQLGLVQLLESTRSLQFAGGEVEVLLDTETTGLGAVLYLNDESDTLPVKPVCGFQLQGVKESLAYAYPVSQHIPARYEGKEVVSVTVLEKYSLYFMQNAAPDKPDAHIWTPVHLPVVWGWSIRVQQRFDGVWDIFRKKLILPTTSTEILALPLWQGNSLQCQKHLIAES